MKKIITITLLVLLTVGLFVSCNADAVESIFPPEEQCIAAGTKITMSDGSLKPVEDLVIGDVVRTFDHETGLVSSAPVCFLMKSENVYGAFTLHFDNDINITVIQEHGFYDSDLNKYVFISADNANDYIGHHFYNVDQECQIELKSFELLTSKVDAYAIVTSKHLNHMAEGMLSICDGSIKLFANIFEFDSNMMINETKKAQDIERYGLTEKEVFRKYNGYEEADYEDYNLQYTNILIGKGLVTWKEIEEYYNLCAMYLESVN